jgi:hypothetical protein
MEEPRRTNGVSFDTDILQRDAKAKDREEIEEKRIEYHDYMEWKDQGIVHDLETQYQIFNPTIHLLLPIALLMADVLDVPIGRQEKRRKDLLIGWLNKNYVRIQPYLPRMVIIDERGDLRGPHASNWRNLEGIGSTDDGPHQILKDSS